MANTKQLLFFLVCGLPSVDLAAETVILKSGLTGITGAVSGTTREIHIQTTAGVRSIPIDQVLSIQFGPAQAPLGKKASTRSSILAPAGSTPAAMAEYLKSADAHLKAHEYEEALQDCQKALDVKKSSSLAHYLRGEAYFQLENLQGAANEFRAALVGDSDAAWVEVWAHIGLGKIFDRTNQRERALNEYIQAARTGDDTNGANLAIAEFEKTLCRQEVCADYIRLKNGDGSSGNWLGSEGNEVQFQVGGKLQKYEKSVVWAVLFGVDAPIPSAVAPNPKALPPPAAVVTPLATAATQPAQAAYGPDPEWIGAVFFRNDSSQLIPLERSTATYVRVGSGFGYSPLRLYNGFYAIDGLRCSVRVKDSEKLVFVVRLANGVDPRVFGLYPLETKKGSRITKVDTKKKTLISIPFHVTRAGAYSYALLPDSALPAGEYSFSPKTSNDTYCFGIDR